MAGKWTRLTAHGAADDLERITAVMSMIDNGLMIEDYRDLTVNGMYGELMDEKLLHADRTRVAVSCFLPEEKHPHEALSSLRDRFSSLGIAVALDAEGLDEEDWAESWKQYYAPISLGRVTIVPAWQSYAPREGEVIVRMDPGMAFGTGTHETTRLVISLLEKHLTGGERVLDVGTGSGILAICARKLGAASCAAYDIDPVAVRVARDNCRENGCPEIEVGTSDLLHGVSLAGGPFDLCLANIVAEILCRMAPDLGAYLSPDATVIVSGVVAEKAALVEAAMTAAGFTRTDTATLSDWVALCYRKNHRA